MQKCQPLRFHFGHKKINSSQVAARPCQTGYKTKLYGIIAYAEDDRGCRGCIFSHTRCKVAGGRGDDGHTAAHEIGHKRLKTIEFALQPMVLHRYVLALEVAGFIEAVSERRGKRCIE